MWTQMAILAGGYAIIVLSYAWVWVIATAMSREFPFQRLPGVSKADVKVLGITVALWNIVWAVLQPVELVK
jgi:hypothetical protein